ncbi:MAG: hypothetical protein MNPFHGCM_00278 [Gemmatimonadaceae bacterium]|nr:hypothetical protein [Gemmatimonadaceae bacterium]
MAHAPLPVIQRRRFGETLRRDAWWVSSVPVVVILTAFIAYATWAAFQNAHYTFGPYLSPFYSPELLGDSPHAWFGPKPVWWPGWLPFSPALLILPIPASFRFSCYYYRGSYYKAFWQDPPACAVGEPRKTYLGERFLPLSLQNFHRYGLLASLIVWFVLVWDVWRAFWFTAPGVTQATFGIGVGSLILLLNVILLGGYLFGCHSFRHVLGGYRDVLSGSTTRTIAYDCSSCLNRAHMKWAWASLLWVAFADLYIRLCSLGIWTDVRIV